MKDKFTSTIAGASIFITLIGLISRAFGVVREALFANFFGLSVQFDLFLVGTVLPVTLNTIVLYVAQNYFIPNYNRIKVGSEDDAKRFTVNSFFVFAAAGVILFSILYALSGKFLNAYIGGETEGYSTALDVFRIFIVTVPFNAASSILMAYLQSEFEFKFPAVSQLIMNIMVIVLVVIGQSGWGIYSIPLGYATGALLQLIFLIWQVKSKSDLKFLESEFSLKRLNLVSFSFLFIIFIETVGQIYALVDRYFYNSVETGGIAALNYATTIYLLPITIISISLATALFPKVSWSFVTDSKSELKNQLKNFFSINIFLFIPVCFVFYFYGDAIIKIILERGEFTANDTEMTFAVLRIYTFSLLFFSSYAAINKMLYSFDLIKLLLFITFAASVVKIILNFLFVDYYQQEGLALSTSISYFVYFIIGYPFVFNKLKIKESSLFVKELIFSIVNAGFSFLIVKILVDNLLIFNNFMSAVISIIFFTAIYLLNAFLVSPVSFGLITNTFQKIKTLKLKDI